MFTHNLLFVGTTTSTGFGSGFSSSFGTTSSGFGATSTTTPTFNFSSPVTTTQSIFSGFGQPQSTSTGGRLFK